MQSYYNANEIFPSMCWVKECSDSPQLQNKNSLSHFFFFFCIGHRLNALLFHPGPEKTRSLFLTAGCPRTVAPINEAPCSRPAEPSAADDGRA